MVGVLAQALLGGITVLTGLNPLIVSAHFLLSMVTLTLAVLLVWRIRRDRSGHDRATSVRSRSDVLGPRHGALGAVVVFVGTLVTASGPHSGGEGTGRRRRRLADLRVERRSVDLISTHARIATVFGIVTIAVFVFALVRRAGQELLIPLAAVSC